MKFTLKSKVKWVVLVFCIILFLLITKSVYDEETIFLDIMGYKYISKLMSPSMTIAVKSITNLGGVICLALILFCAFLFIRIKKIGFLITINLLISAGFNFLLKNIIARPRPIEYPLINETGYSFPSGHSMISMAFYGFIIYLVYKKMTNKVLKIALIVLLSIIILLIGSSRIYLGVHYTSDVIGGFLIGLSYLIVFTYIVKSKV